MLIKSVEVKNYRSIREQRLDCENLTALVGRNGSGKSSFLYAIDIFYDTAASISSEDFFERDLNSTIEIRVTFGDLRDIEKEEFKTYIKDDKLIVTKRILFEDNKFIQRYFAAAMQIPEFYEIRSKSKKGDRVSAWKELVDSGKLQNLTVKPRSADDIEKVMIEYEMNHPDLMQPLEREEQFFGPKTIGGGKLDKFTKYVLVPAVRKASDEASGKKGAIDQLLDMIVLRKVNARNDIREFKTEFEQRVKTLYNSANLYELPELGASISKTLEKFAPGSKLNLNWDEVKLPEIQLPSAKATLIEDNFEGEISRKGHGLQRALIVTLLQHLAMMSPTVQPDEEASKEAVNQDLVTLQTDQGPDLILAIEEPELYLHPSRNRYMSELLLQLAERPDLGFGGRNQIIYATHSPYYVDLYRFDKIRVIRKAIAQDTVVPHSVVTSFTLEQASKELAQVCSVDPTKFTRDSFRAHSISIINSIVSEGFFADLVVIVEGQSEVGVLWKLQEIMGKNWAQLGISIVPTGGKNNLDRPVIIFRGLKIPTYFIFDADVRHKGGKKDTERETIRRNHCYIRLAGGSIDDFPETQIHETWTVFKDNLEKSLEDELGRENFISICEKVASATGYEEPSHALKNIEGAASFVDRVYAGGGKLSILEKVVEAITQLCKKMTL